MLVGLVTLSDGIVVDVGIAWKRSGKFGTGYGFGCVYLEKKVEKLVGLGRNRKNCLCFLCRSNFLSSSDAFTFRNVLSFSLSL